MTRMVEQLDAKLPEEILVAGGQCDHPQGVQGLRVGGVGCPQDDATYTLLHPLQLPSLGQVDGGGPGRGGIGQLGKYKGVVYTRQLSLRCPK